MPLHDDIQTSGPRNHHAARSDLVRFRLWREGALPRADYQLAASFWTPTSLARAVGLAEHERRMVKRSEPQITGVAYTTRHLYLAVVASVGDYEHVAQASECTTHTWPTMFLNTRQTLTALRLGQHSQRESR